MLDCVSIGARIRYHRMLNNLSQEELAERAGTNRVHISNIERGEKTPSLELIVSIANALYISSDDLLAGNLLATGNKILEDEMDILFDCSHDESCILLECMRAVKKVIRGYNITK